MFVGSTTATEMHKLQAFLKVQGWGGAEEGV